MSIDLYDSVQLFANDINANPNLSADEKTAQIQNYALSMGISYPNPQITSDVAQIIATDGSPIMGASPDYTQGVADQTQFNTSLAADAALAQYLTPGQVILPIDVNYGGPPTINPNIPSDGSAVSSPSTDASLQQGLSSVPAVDEIPIGPNDYLPEQPPQNQYPLVDFALEQAQAQTVGFQVPIQLTEKEYVPEWLAPFVTWVQTYNKPT